ncbi:alpha/beta fold hydrolase [Tenacibaculum sp. M341]|uniref:alpha/beta fold hydrolase n=1 Tax=Tenacibaculum sp. M341 TaxID=2530339 RepID=UPI0010473325|nr:alpha/beta hydrolase [Tenacibaculum sp. M341]TCI91433.1 alpha/beta hydrolase [Tenacibaculum sp. M341]
MNIQEWKDKGSFIDYNGQAIFYVDEGEGDVLLLIHGFPTSSWDWCKVWTDLVSNYRVIALDMIGFGFSDKPKAYKYSILNQADIHEFVLKQLSVDNCAILSHDYGDTVAQELLARFNSGKLSFSVNSLCLLNGGLFPEVHKPRFIQKLLISPIGFLISLFTSKKKFTVSFKAIFGSETQPTSEEIDQFWELMNYNKGKKIMHRLIRYMEERKKYRQRWVGALESTNIPLRLINGVVDPISGKHMADRYKELISNSDVILLDEIGHYPQTEAPEQVLKYYIEFVNKTEIVTV